MISVLYAKPKKLAGMQSIFVSFPYKAKIVDAIRMIPERFWDGKNKVWELPYDALSELKTLLPKEEFSICGKPMDDSKYGEKKLTNTYTLPKEIKTKLYDYQYEVFNETMNFDKYLLLLEQGTGKTISAISVALKRRELNQIKHCLVICCVNGLKYNWEDEIYKHTSMPCTILGNRQNKKGVWQTGSTKDKLEDLEELNEFFIITNIESLRSKEIKERLKKLMDKGEINMIICDEIHKASNPASQQGKALLLLAKHVNYFLGLTGTVLTNSALDAYTPLKVVGGEIANYTQFKARYCVMGGFGGYSVVSYKNMGELQQKLNKCSIRLTKEECLDLPEKVHITEYVEMGAEQKKIYSQVMLALMEDIDKISVSPDPLSLMIRARQATASTAILSSTVNKSAKIDRLKELLEEIEGKVVIFTNWTKVTDVLEKELSNYKYAIITGQVKDREAQRKKFIEDKECKILIGTIGACGTGYTFTCANTVIFMDEPMTSANKAQSEDRLHRIGQKNSVSVITLICKHTIDERIHKLVEKKRVLSDTIVDKKYDINNPDVIRYILTGEKPEGFE